MSNYFSNSYQSLVSFLVKDKNLDVEKLDELIKLAEELKNKK
jgi:BlaI family penicillinase repressor